MTALPTISLSYLNKLKKQCTYLKVEGISNKETMLLLLGIFVFLLQSIDEQLDLCLVNLV